MFWTAFAAIAFFLDTADALDYANYSEADYTLILESLALSMSQLGLQLYSYGRIRVYGRHQMSIILGLRGSKPLLFDVEKKSEVPKNSFLVSSSSVS